MTEKYFLLNVYKMTKNAERILDDYLERARQVSEDESLSPEQFQQFAEGQISGRIRLAGEEGELDAEKMMNVLRESGTAQTLVQKYREMLAANPKTSLPVYKKLQLSEKDRVVGGVCGGIAEYFQIDAVLVRVAFVVCCLIAGVTFWLYPVMWMVLDRGPKIKYPPLVGIFYHMLRIIKLLLRPIVSLVSPKKKTQASLPVENFEPVTAGQTPISAAPAKKGLLAKMFALAAFLFMTVFIYLPATVALLSGACFCLWGIFYPIVDIDGFRFSFSDLNTPGTVLAISAAVLLFSMFMLIITFMGRLHFKSKVIGKNGLVVVMLLVIVSLFGAASSTCMTVFQNQAESSMTLTKSFPVDEKSDTVHIGPEQFIELNNTWLKIRHIHVYSGSEQGKVIVRCQVKARGENEEQVRDFLERINVKWQENGYFPIIEKSDEKFHFEEVTLEIILPTGKKLAIEGECRHRLLFDGKFGDEVKLDMENSDLHLENFTAGKLIVTGKACSLSVEESDIENFELTVSGGLAELSNVKCGEIRIENKNSDISFEKSSGKLTLNNDRGSARIIESEGSFAIENSDGRVMIRDYRFSENSVNTLKSDRGKIKIFLKKNYVPQVKMENGKGKVKNLLPTDNTCDAVIKIEATDSKVLLAPCERPRRGKKNFRKHRHSEEDFPKPCSPCRF